MFESIRLDDAATRLRNAAIVPLAAFLFALFYFTFSSFLSRVPAALFWSIAAMLFIASMVGAIRIVRAARSERMRGRALAWLIASVVVELACIRLFLAMVLPWI